MVEEGEVAETDKKDNKPQSRAVKKRKPKYLKDDNPRIEEIIQNWAQVVNDWCFRNRSTAHRIPTDKRKLTLTVLKWILENNYPEDGAPPPLENSASHEGADNNGNRAELKGSTEGDEVDEEDGDEGSWRHWQWLAVASLGLTLIAVGATLLWRSKTDRSS